jgi:hypothetical protein
MNKQRGMTLLVALIMLVIMTLAAVLSFKLGRNNTLITGNQQARQATTDVAVAALEETISRPLFAQSPTASFGSSNEKSYDINADGTNDITVQLSPQPCIRSYVLLPVDPDDASAQGCIGGAQQSFGVEGGSSWGTNCADVIWEITAVATDQITEAQSIAVQGVRIRQDANATVNTANFCP